MAEPDRPRQAEAAGTAPAPGGRRSRSAQRDEAARAALEPLEEGERPAAVTVAAVVAALLAAAQLTAFIVALAGGSTQRGGVLAYQVLVIVILVAAAAGMWRARYWAVLGMQALLGIHIVLGMLVLLTTGAFDLRTAVVVLIVIASGALFWFLVKAMARMQMPGRP